MERRPHKGNIKDLFLPPTSIVRVDVAPHPKTLPPLKYAVCSFNLSNINVSACLVSKQGMSPPSKGPRVLEESVPPPTTIVPLFMCDLLHWEAVAMILIKRQPVAASNLGKIGRAHV
jgi:hypothetical protein